MFLPPWYTRIFNLHEKSRDFPIWKAAALVRSGNGQGVLYGPFPFSLALQLNELQGLHLPG